MAEHCRFHGGIHPAAEKRSSGEPIQVAPLFELYTVPLQQHIGAAPKILVQKKDRVLRGQLLAEPGGFVSAAIHAPTSGIIKNIDECLGPNGVSIPAVEIESDGEDTAAADLLPMPDWQNVAVEELKSRISAAGVVGMGGAAFPTHVKLSPPPAKKIDVLILNGVECEPCLTADHRLMLEETERILTGAEIIAKILGAKDVYIGIEENKPDAIELMGAAARGRNLNILSLHVRYPQGAEKQLIYAATKRKVPTGGLPMDVGCVVQNVATAAAITDAVVDGKPLYERVTTLAGSPLVQPGNWRFRVGTSLSEALRLAQGVKSDPAKIIFGGPMMGMSIYALETPIVKNTSGVLLLAASEISQFTSEACIRCGQCVNVCPMDLMPGTLSVQIENERFELAEKLYAMDCIECGCCAYMCPAHRPLVHHLRRAKAEIMASRRNRAGKSA